MKKRLCKISKCMLTNKLTFAVSSSFDCKLSNVMQNCLVKANLDIKVGTHITRTLEPNLAILLKTAIKYVKYSLI